MQKVLILGGGGMIGQKLKARIETESIFPDAEITLFDRAFPQADTGARQVVGDAADPATAQTLAEGRYDVICPPATAYRLAAAWPASDLAMIDDAGHALSEPGITSALIEATDRFAST